MSRESFREIALLALNYRQQMGEHYLPDTVSRAVAAAERMFTRRTPSRLVADEIANEFLRCRLINHTWNGSIA